MIKSFKYLQLEGVRIRLYMSLAERENNNENHECYAALVGPKCIDIPHCYIKNCPLAVMQGKLNL